MTLLCPLCNSAKTTFLFSKQQNPHYRCRKCRFVFARPQTNANLQNKLKDFEPAYLNYLSEQAHDKKNHDALLKKLSRHKALEGSKVLDIGCGSGKLVKYLRTKGVEAYGIEPSTALFDEFLKNEPFFFKGAVADFIIKNPGARFDLIIAADVIEHVEQPVMLMRDIAGLLSPGGIVFISTPDVNSVFARVAGKRWHYYNRYHLSLFSKQSLGRLAQAYGLMKIEAGHVTRYQSLFYVIKYGWNFLLRTDKGVPEFFKSFNFPINLYDNQFAVFQRLS
jgi:2-polyprenyl-3-methyl-5-hydroxy-6-metoxy-1,4-benzoquinol methylase